MEKYLLSIEQREIKKKETMENNTFLECTYFSIFYLFITMYVLIFFQMKSAQYSAKWMLDKEHEYQNN